MYSTKQLTTTHKKLTKSQKLTSNNNIYPALHQLEYTDRLWAETL
jgi:hypothetical protein